MSLSAEANDTPNPDGVPPYAIVAHPGDLEPLMRAIRAHPSVAVDTEADSLHHYHEKVCLIQLTVDGGHWIVDPLAEGMDLEPLIRLLEERPLILHGADYDLRLLRKSHGFRPRRLVDTMLAAQLLGWTEFGLAALVERVCGISLSKHGQRADWSVRPLPETLLAYAVDDTRYLHRVAASMLSDLEKLERLGWLEECCQRLLETTAVESTPARDQENAWRIRGGRHLKGRPAALLRELWQWREEIARHIDRPSFRIAANAFLLEWAGWLEENPKATVAEMPERPSWLHGRRLQSFEAAVERALAMRPADWPKPPDRHSRQRRYTPEEEDRLKLLTRARDEVAEKLGLQPGFLGPREALRPLVRANPGDPDAFCRVTGLMQWQGACLAPALLPLVGSQ
jgi:ribonuclease D